jgi:hypothetical protein
MQNQNSNIKYAWLDDTTIRDVCVGDPAELFHQDVAVLFNTVVPSDAQSGDTFAGGVLTKLEPLSLEPEVFFPKVNSLEFKLLFTSQERIAIKTARKNDAVIDDFYDIVEDPLLQYVDLGLESTQEALAYLVTQNLLTEERKKEILNGLIK